MSIFNYIISKTFLKNILLAIGVLVALSFAAYKWMDVYTHHKEVIIVPNLSKIQLTQVEHILGNSNLSFAVIDSLYREDFDAGMIIDQDPKSGSQVKEGRIIYLTIATGNQPKVPLPNLLEMSLRQAKIMLSNSGLQLGEVTTQPDIFTTNLVIEARFNNQILRTGEMIPKLSKIDLVVSINNLDSLVAVPNLVGLSIIEAEMLLGHSLLNLGSIIPVGAVSDSTRLYVLRQKPASGSEPSLNVGSIVDIWVEQK